MKSIRFYRNIKLSRHTSASSAAHQCAAAHSLGNTALISYFAIVFSLIQVSADNCLLFCITALYIVSFISWVIWSNKSIKANACQSKRDDVVSVGATRTGCTLRIRTRICARREQWSEHGSRLLAATVWSFAHLPLRSPLCSSEQRHKHTRRKGQSMVLVPQGFEIMYFPSNVLVEKYLSLSFDLVKWNFTIVGPTWTNPSDAHGHKAVISNSFRSYRL